jgi:hypothetical protein
VPSHQVGAHSPGAGDQRRFPPGLRVPAAWDGSPCDVPSRVVVRGLGAGLRRRLVVVAADVDLPGLGDLPGLLLAGQRRQLRTRIQSQGGAGGADVVETFVGGLGGEVKLRHRRCLIYLGPGGGEPLGGISQRLPGGGVAGCIYGVHLSSEPLGAPPRLGAGVGDLPGPGGPVLPRNHHRGDETTITTTHTHGVHHTLLTHTRDRRRTAALVNLASARAGPTPKLPPINNSGRAGP